MREVHVFRNTGELKMTTRHLALFAGIVLTTMSVSPLAAQQSKLRIVQTNSAGDKRARARSGVLSANPSRSSSTRR